MQSCAVDPGALRRATLAASVLHDIPLRPSAGGVLVASSWDDDASWTPVTWADLAEAVGGADPESLAGRLRLRDWLQAYTFLCHLPPAHDAPQRVVALALPVGHVLHPGPSWVVQSVLGGVLDVGLGLRPAPLPDDRDGAADLPGSDPQHLPVPVPLPAGAARAAGAETARWWGWAVRQRDSMAVLATDRLERTARGMLRPIGGCDVLTLLSAPWLRQYLAAADGTGMRAVAAPMRSRAWFDLARIDPAFVGAAAAATEPELRGATRPLLVTADEITMAPTAAPIDLARAGLADPAGVTSLLDRDVLYR